MDRTGSNEVADSAAVGEAMPPVATQIGWPDRTLLVVCLLASSAWCVTASPRLGATFDEPNYIANGLERWRSGSYKRLLRQGTMPLPVDVITAPLYVWERVRGMPFQISSNAKSEPVILDDLHRLLAVARCGTLVFWWLLLVYAWRIGGLAGPWGRRLAVILTASEPNLLAHATLATTDIAVTACLLMLAWHFAVGRSHGWKRRVLVPGVLFGVALLTKASALVFGPLCLCAIELHRLWTSREDRNGLSGVGKQRQDWFRPFVRDARQIVFLGLATAIIYVGTEFKPEPSFVEWAQELPEGSLRQVMLPVAENLRIFPNAGEGLAYQIKHNLRGHGVYILGETHRRALWYYFPLALAIKLNLALLLPVLVACLCPRALRNWAMLAAGVLILFSVTYRVQIGIRLVLPLIALLVVGIASSAAVALTTQSPGHRRRFCVAMTGVCCAWMVLSSGLNWPHALAYTNGLFCSDLQGRPVLCDSNVDWGQGLPELDDWRKRRGLDRIDVWYFGTDPAAHEAPFRPVPLQQVEVAELDQLRGQVQGAHLAVSTTLLYGPSLTPQQQATAELLRRVEPVDQTSTYYIFKLRPGPSLPAVAVDDEMAVRR